MTMRIGLSIASDHVRAVGVRAGDVLWTIEAPRTSEGELAGDIVTLLQHGTLPRWPRALVVAAIGPAASQTKRLTGLPAIADAAELRSIVRESTSRFFLSNGVPLVTSGVRIAELGLLWAAAFELPTIRAIESACSTLGLRLRMIVPSILALPLALEGERTEWTDGSVRSEITYANGELGGTRRLSAVIEGNQVQEPKPTVVAALRPLGAEAWKYADAYGATRLSDDEPLALRSSTGELDPGSSRRGVRIAAAALCVALCVAIGVPTLARVVQEHHSAAQLTALVPQARQAEAAEIDLARMSAALTEVAKFDESRISSTVLLSQLARALPEGCVLVTVRIDTAGGIVALLAPRAASALAALDSVADVTAPQIIGPVTREIVGTRELERATVQFRFASTLSRAQ